MKIAFLLFTATLVVAASAAKRCRRDSCVCRKYKLPKDFLLGAATASYQIEGGWKDDGKGESIWDHLTHEDPSLTLDGSNGDVAADSYHKYKEDVQMLKNMNMNVYRFSISWPRILPKGTIDYINEEGLKYYEDLIDELLKNDIKPMVTMYHWDLPYTLQTLGGWTNPQTAIYFRDYADLLFKRLGDKVEWWITINEPQSFCFAGYGSAVHHAPDVGKPGVAEYLCGHTLLLAHSLAYKVYEDQYRSVQNGKVGITLNSFWDIPKTNSAEDTAAADRSMQFWLGWFANPIFSSDGDYPAVMKERVLENSNNEGLPRSRLPVFTEDEIELIRGSADFFGLNHYTTRYVEDVPDEDNPLLMHDVGVTTSRDDTWESSASDWLKVVPWGFRENLKWVKENYNSPTIIVTENGVSDSTGTLDDERRVDYYRKYLREMVKAMEDDKVNVIGYTAWSLMDNFEWLSGYTERFGLYHVDFGSEERTRTPKKSAIFFKELGKTRVIPRKVK